MAIGRTIQMKHRCGFCSNGNHTNCAVAVLNGDGTTAVRCPCTCATGRTRCVVCRRLGVEIDGGSRCADRDACQAHLDSKPRVNWSGDPIEPVQVRSVPLPDSARRPAPKLRTPRVTAGACRCCGEPTKGGQFLPGHDARYASQQVERFAAERPADPAAWLAALQVGPKLAAKIARRLSID